MRRLGVFPVTEPTLIPPEARFYVNARDFTFRRLVYEVGQARYQVFVYRQPFEVYASKIPFDVEDPEFFFYIPDAQEERLRALHLASYEKRKWSRQQVPAMPVRRPRVVGL